MNRLFVLVFDNTENGDKKVERDSNRKYFLPRVDITNYNVLIDGRDFYDQPINDQIKKYDEIRKVATGKGNLQLNKLKSAVKNKQRITLRMNARMFSGNNLPHELLLTTRQTTKLRNAIENNLQTDIKLLKAQISKIIQSGGFLGKVLGPLLKTGLPLLKSVIKLLGIFKYVTGYIRS